VTSLTEPGNPGYIDPFDRSLKRKLVLVMPTNMPPDVEKLFQELSDALTDIHFKWKLYCQLYCDEDSVELINACAPIFFANTQAVYADYILLALSRLTDPSRTGRYSNLSLERLRQAIDPAAHPSLSFTLAAAATSVEVACADFRTHRDKRIAHTDEGVSDGDVQLPAVYKRDIDDALKKMRDLMNAIVGEFDDAEVAYADPIVPEDGTRLIKVLKAGRDAQIEKRRKRAERWGVSTRTVDSTNA